MSSSQETSVRAVSSSLASNNLQTIKSNEVPANPHSLDKPIPAHKTLKMLKPNIKSIQIKDSSGNLQTLTLKSEPTTHKDDISEEPSPSTTDDIAGES